MQLCLSHLPMWHARVVRDRYLHPNQGPCLSNICQLVRLQSCACVLSVNVASSSPATDTAIAYYPVSGRGAAYPGLPPRN